MGMCRCAPHFSPNLPRLHRTQQGNIQAEGGLYDGMQLTLAKRTGPPERPFNMRLMRFLLLLSVVAVLWCAWFYWVSGIVIYDTNLIAFRKLTDDEGVRVSNTCTEILRRLAIPPMVLNVLWVFAGIVEYGVLVHRKRMADKNGVDRRVENPYNRQREGLTTLARRIRSALQRDVKDFFTEFLRKRATSGTMRVFLILLIVLTVVVAAWCGFVYRVSGITLYAMNASALKKLTGYEAAGICDVFNGSLLMLAVPSMLLNVVWCVAAVPMYRALGKGVVVQ